MDNKTLDVTTTIGSVVTGSIALIDIQNILSITILILSILNILINMAVRIYNHIKNKKYEEISNDVNKTIDDLNNLKNKNNKEKGD